MTIKEIQKQLATAVLLLDRAKQLIPSFGQESLMIAEIDIFIKSDPLLEALQETSANAGVADDGVQRDSKAWTNSPTLSQAVYFPATRVLRLHFTSGAIYDFFEVHPSTWNGMKDADSPGNYYNTNIKQHDNKKVL